MKKNNTVRNVTISILVVLLILLIAIVVNFTVHVVRTNNFNNQIHKMTSSDDSKEVVVNGRLTGEWPKEDALVSGVTNGGTYEVTVTDEVNYKISIGH